MKLLNFLYTKDAIINDKLYVYYVEGKPDAIVQVIGKESDGVHVVAFPDMDEFIIGEKDILLELPDSEDIEKAKELFSHMF